MSDYIRFARKTRLKPPPRQEENNVYERMRLDTYACTGVGDRRNSPRFGPRVRSWWKMVAKRHVDFFQPPSREFVQNVVMRMENDRSLDVHAAQA